MAQLEIGFDKNRKPITLNDIDSLNTIKQALQRLEQIDNAKPSEA